MSSRDDPNGNPSGGLSRPPWLSEVDAPAPPTDDGPRAAGAAAGEDPALTIRHAQPPPGGQSDRAERAERVTVRPPRGIEQSRSRAPGPRRSVGAYIGIGVVAAVACLVAGFGLGGGLGSGDATAGGTAECPESDGTGTGSETGTGASEISGAGPGSLDTPGGAVLAFNHGYYVERSAEAAFRAVSDSSTMTPERLQNDGIDLLPEQTAHCVRASEISPGLLDVTLREIRPDGSGVEIRQRAHMEETADGEWRVVTLQPVG